jgi:hypothetical protein
MSNDSRARFFNHVRATEQGVPHISLVFREMWETRALMFFASWVESLPV